MAYNSFDLSKFSTEIIKGALEDEFDDLGENLSSLVGIALHSLNYVDVQDKSNIEKRISFIEKILNDLWLGHSVEYAAEVIKTKKAEFNASDYLFNRPRYTDRLPKEVRSILERRNRVLAKKKVFASVLAIIDNEVNIYEEYYKFKGVPNPKQAAIATVNLKYPKFDLKLLYSLKTKRSRASYLETQALGLPAPQNILSGAAQDLQVRAVAAKVNQQITPDSALRNIESAWHPVVAESMRRLKAQRDFTDNFMKGYHHRMNKVFNATADMFMANQKLYLSKSQVADLSVKLSKDYILTLNDISSKFSLQQFLSYCKPAGSKYEITPEALTYLNQFAPMQENRGIFLRRAWREGGEVLDRRQIEEFINVSTLSTKEKIDKLYNIHKRLVTYDVKSIRNVSEILADQKELEGQILYMRISQVVEGSRLKTALNRLNELNPNDKKDKKKIKTALKTIEKYTNNPVFRSNICDYCRTKHGTIISAIELIKDPLQIPPSHPHCRCELIRIPPKFKDEILALGRKSPAKISDIGGIGLVNYQNMAKRFLDFIKQNQNNLGLGGITSAAGLAGSKQFLKARSYSRIIPVTLLSGIFAAGVLLAGLILMGESSMPQLKPSQKSFISERGLVLENMLNKDMVNSLLTQSGDEVIDENKMLQSIREITDLDQELELSGIQGLAQESNLIFEELNKEFEVWENLKQKMSRGELLDINELRQLRKADRWIRAFENAEQYREFIYRLNVYEAAVKKIKNFNNREIAEMIQTLLDTEETAEQWKDRLKDFPSILKEDLPEIRFGRDNPRRRNLNFLASLGDDELRAYLSQILDPNAADRNALTEHRAFIDEFIRRVGLEQPPEIRTGRSINLYAIKNRLKALRDIESGRVNIDVILANIKDELSQNQVNMISLEKDLNNRFLFFSEYRTYLKSLKRLLENKNAQMFSNEIGQIDELINTINILYRMSSNTILSFDTEIKEVNMALNNFMKSIRI